MPLCYYGPHTCAHLDTIYSIRIVSCMQQISVTHLKIQRWRSTAWPLTPSLVTVRGFHDNVGPPFPKYHPKLAGSVWAPATLEQHGMRYIESSASWWARYHHQGLSYKFKVILLWERESVCVHQGEHALQWALYEQDSAQNDQRWLSQSLPTSVSRTLSLNIKRWGKLLKFIVYQILT